MLPKGQGAGGRLLRLATALAAPGICVSCGEPPKPPHVAVAPLRPEAPKAPDLAPVRWVPSDDSTVIGPRIAEGTLVLLGGRRALVAPDGTTSIEKAPAPEPLSELILVPTAAGMRVVGAGTHGVFRFDDPLGPGVVIARSQSTIDRLGSAPGAVVVWMHGFHTPRLVNILRLEEASWPAPLPLPIQGIAYLDMSRGVALFQGAGLAATRDGGRSFAAITEEGSNDAVLVKDVRSDAESVWAVGVTEREIGVIHLDRGRLAVIAAPAPSAGAPPLLRWIRATDRDPLEVAVTSGVEGAGGLALLASHGLLARIDVASGAVLEATSFATAAPLDRCGAARAGSFGWFACTAQGANEHGGSYTPFRLFRVRLTEGAPHAERPDVRRNYGNGATDLRVSPSGGVMLHGSCESNRYGAACVLQPKGSYVTIQPEVDLHERGAGPLASGSLAFVRGLRDGEDNDPANARGARSGPELRVVVVDAQGKEQVLETVDFPRVHNNPHIQSPIEEALDHSLRFVIEDGDGPTIVRVGGPLLGASTQRLDGFAVARLHDRFGVAVSQDRLMASVDGGETWAPASIPPSMLPELNAVARRYDEGNNFVVGDVGAKLGSILRIGWGSHDLPLPPSAPLTGGVVISQSAPEQADAGFSLKCVLRAPKPAGTALAPELTPQILRPAKPPPPGTRHDIRYLESSSDSAIVAAMIVEGPDGPNEVATTWEFRWMDPLEFGAGIRTVRVKPPAEVRYYARLTHAASAPGKAFFEVNAGSSVFLVRVTTAGASEIAEVDPNEALIRGEVAFGQGASDVIAWSAQPYVFVWAPHAAPRRVARLPVSTPYILGSPTRTAVPVLLGDGGWRVLRTFAIPPAEPAGSPSRRRTHLADGSPPPLPSIYGGATETPFRGAYATLPICGPTPRGFHFVGHKKRLLANFDGIDASTTSAVYDVWVDGAEACIASVGAFFEHQEGVRDALFLRSDFTHKRSETASSFVSPPRQVSCAHTGSRVGEDPKRLGL